MQRNVTDWERIASVAAGAALLWYAGRRSYLARTAGATLLTRGVTGYCPANAMLGRDRDGLSDTKVALSGSRGIHVRETITVNRPAAELFRFWRDLANLPRFMDHLDRVEVVDSTRSIWTARGPAGSTVTWEAEIINEVDGELIGWRSTERADVATAGSVRFTPAPGGGTEISVHLQYEPPAGKLGSWVAWLFGEEPSQQIRSDLRRLKALLETGEVPQAHASADTRGAEPLYI